MADFNSTSPELYHQVNHNETPSHYERRLDSFPVVSEKTGRVIIDTENNVATILVSGETKKETNELNESFKERFIQKLKKLPDYNGSKVQEAIEAGTIEIKKIPGRDAYAIYESKVGNLVYITRLDGTQYENVDQLRNEEFFSSAIIGGFVRQGYKIEKDVDIWRLYNKDGAEIPTFSNEYSTASLNSVNYMRGVIKSFQEEYKKRQKKKIK